MGIESTNANIKFATASCDKSIKIFTYNTANASFEESIELTGHSDWVRDVCWCPSILNPLDILASCSEVFF